MRNSTVELVIIELLTKQKQHLSANQVYEVLRTRLPAVNPSTVYRALERLTKTGKISVSDMGTGSLVYEMVDRTTIHHHVVCQTCGKVTTLPDDIIHEFIEKVVKFTRYEITTNHLVLFGHCAECVSNSRVG